jgi:predicted nucleic acid-binding protein
MKYLVDVNVLGEPTKPAPNPKVVQWLRENEREVVIDSVVLAEVRRGILSLPRGKRRSALEHWFESGVHRIVCLPWDADVALVWAELASDLAAKGRMPSLFDSMIAATARRHGLTVATRNSADFKATGVKTVNPFES